MEGRVDAAAAKNPAVVYAAAASQVTHSWIHGQCVMRERQLLTLDEQAVVAGAAEWALNIQQDNPGEI